jgi:hypothetical protein
MRCPIGADHAAGRLPGQWPNGEPVQRFDLPVAPSAASEAPETTRRRKGVLVRREPARAAVVASATGERRTVSAWARTVGMLPATLRARLKAGLALEQALAAPNNAGRRWEL